MSKTDGRIEIMLDLEASWPDDTGDVCAEEWVGRSVSWNTVRNEARFLQHIQILGKHLRTRLLKTLQESHDA